jgi:hypothetical protein
LIDADMTLYGTGGVKPCPGKRPVSAEIVAMLTAVTAGVFL